ncbi:MAG: 5'-nucleotidase, partial [Sinobacteraceae bacterium]|nr:5'-nucleotidase [Nevskiaceae bacterium]
MKQAEDNEVTKPPEIVQLDAGKNKAAVDAQAEAPLTVAISSRAVFQLDAEDEIWRSQGTAAYRAYQRKHEREPLAPGPAFAFVKRLLALNDIRPEAPLVDVILLSRNDPDTGLRAFNSIEHHGLPISRAAFLSGSSPFRYLEAFHAALFLSMNEEDVNAAIEAGHPAGRVLPTAVADDVS